MSADKPAETLRVTYVLRAFPRLSETFILHEILALRAMGVSVQVLALERVREATCHPAAAALLPEVRFAPDAPAAPVPRVRVPRSQRRFLSAAPWVAQHLRRHRSQHVHAHFAGPAATVAALAARTVGIRYSFTAHAKDIFTDEVDWGWLEGLAREASAVVTVCDRNRRFLRARLPGARVVRIYNGVDLPAARLARGAGGGGPVVSVARFVRKKGLEVLVDALALLHARGVRVRAVLAGDGREHAAVAERVRQHALGRWVKLPGALARPEVQRLLSRASCVALPAVVDADGNQDALPTVLLEAGAYALPSVSTPIGGIAEIVRHRRTGYLVPPHDARALARALERLHRSPALRVRMGAAARAHMAAAFDPAVAVRSLMREFAAAVRRGPQARPARALARTPRPRRGASDATASALR